MCGSDIRVRPNIAAVNLISLRIRGSILVVETRHILLKVVLLRVRSRERKEEGRLSKNVDIRLELKASTALERPNALNIRRATYNGIKEPI